MSRTSEEAAQFGRKPAAPPAELWREAAEAIEVVVRLWDSWEDGAVIRDVAARGGDRVGLEVDADSPTGADGLYRAMGWVTDYVTESWHQDVTVG